MDFGAIDERINNFIYAFFQVRNRYAHHISNAHLTVVEICSKIAADGDDPHLLEEADGYSPIDPARVNRDRAPEGLHVLQGGLVPAERCQPSEASTDAVWWHPRSVLR
jgi:hypothetical protein